MILATRGTLWAALTLSLIAAGPARADIRPGLAPGAFEVLDQTIPVHLVFVGYDRAAIDLDRFRAQLPATYRPVVRYPQYYGLDGRNMGLAYRFRYTVDFTSRAFDDAFFGFLTRRGIEGPVTLYQQAYNDQTRNVLDVTGPVLYIDGPIVEQYLQAQDGRRRDGYTIYFINWYGRPDFRFHVYTKTDEPDPDTGYNFGVLRASRQMIAWGGSNSRTWFYDLSAGPEAWTSNYVVDSADTYHMPPIWEYAPGAYVEPEFLAQDLGYVARFVGIDLLFTTSPLYDPLTTAPGLGGGKVAHVAMLEDDPASSGASYFNAAFMTRQLRRFQPYHPWTVGVSDVSPIDPGADKALGIFTETVSDPSECWAPYGSTFAQLFCYFDANLGTYVPAYRRHDYVGEVFAYNTTDTALGEQYGLLGFADDNWVDGTQSYVFIFDTAGYRELGFGFTATATHEFGHHIGMSHPHDGYDSELDADFGPSQLEFAWSGDESHTVMHYLSLSNGFGRFDQDNAHRWETAGYLNWANALVADVLAHRDAPRVWLLLLAAEVSARGAKASFARWDYLTAASAARLAYTLVETAANQIGVQSAALMAARRALPGRVRPDGCRIRYPQQ